jgi:hypothetical protein
MLVLGFLWCLAAYAETGPPLWRFAHPNAKSLIGLEVGRIRRSNLQAGLSRSFEKTWLESAARHLPGVELLDQIEQVLISSPGSANADDASEPPILVLVRGHFDPVKVRQLLRERGAKPQSFAGITVFRPQGKATNEFGFAVLDAETILAGDAKSIFSSIERMRVPAEGPASALMARAETFKSDYDFWVVMTEPSALASQRLPFAALTQSGLMQRVSGVEFGLSLKDGLVVTGSLLMGVDQNARALKDELSKLLKLAVRDQATPPELIVVAKKLKLDLDGSAVRFSLRLAKPDLEVSLRKLQARHHPPGNVLVESSPVLPPKPQFIRIEGLDEGAREIKYTPQAAQPH